MAGKSSLQKLRLVLWGAVALAAIVGGAILLGEAQQAVRQGAELPGAKRLGGDFTLTRANGETFSSSELKGHPYILFFGFTHCPDICPTTLLEITKHLESIGSATKDLKVLFVSVDPERDTPELMAQYMSSFDPRIIGLTGTPEQIAKVGKLYRAFYEKVPQEGGDYTMNHTATVFLFDANGALQSTLSWQEDGATREAKIKRLVGDKA
ncbi:conserved exported protein of unknown function [Candidatus Filomicrobium marinum]|uniref:Thioredoxin domain-containing protein n=2 Tax=Filomicrobium TaxID=119044 RepID=A0A0D6JEV5_9HYPH|nr:MULTISPECIES: SCO family protein [Filomicrobium]MCV0370284.1 SCO family protein [Filomicrobium sp.]CFX22781.1 conserved exported protein of unknown function [Candidatus Filomicrobium marinum]CPR18959.1 conserved exported protein of unknown function [Candidatus Filomicrobium marinum]SDO12002.1 protein SCO1/2 [Filomicrobium insigne]